MELSSIKAKVLEYAQHFPFHLVNFFSFAKQDNPRKLRVMKTQKLKTVTSQKP